MNSLYMSDRYARRTQRVLLDTHLACSISVSLPIAASVPFSVRLALPVPSFLRTVLNFVIQYVGVTPPLRIRTRDGLRRPDTCVLRACMCAVLSRSVASVSSSFSFRGRNVSSFFTYAESRALLEYIVLLLLLYIIRPLYYILSLWSKKEKEREREIYVVSRPPGTVVLSPFSAFPPLLLLLHFFLLHLFFSLTRLSIVFFALDPLFVPPCLPAPFSTPSVPRLLSTRH